MVLEYFDILHGREYCIFLMVDGTFSLWSSPIRTHTLRNNMVSLSQSDKQQTDSI